MMAINLKAYTSRAKELEAAIYTQKKLMAEYEQITSQREPRMPVRKKVALNKPVMPCLVNYTFQETYRNHLICGIVMSIFCVTMTIWYFLEFGIDLFSVIIPGCFAFAAYFYLRFAFRIIANNKSRRETGEMEYKRALDNYNQQLEAYNAAIATEEIQYNANCQEYETRYAEYLNNKQVMVDKHNLVIYSLEKALQELYDENIIFPKYRNMVAITMINEYLESGRCFALEGAEGAYNLYEMELRQNVIIGQLSSIISNLEQIRNNQYSLYEVLTKSNEQVNEIVYEMKNLNNTAKLNAYYNYVTAIAEISPKIYRSINL